MVSWTRHQCIFIYIHLQRNSSNHRSEKQQGLINVYGKQCDSSVRDDCGNEQKYIPSESDFHFKFSTVNTSVAQRDINLCGGLCAQRNVYYIGVKALKDNTVIKAGLYENRGKKNCKANFVRESEMGSK